MKNPRRIFHLIKSLGRGGAEVLLSQGLRYADRSRYIYGYGYFLPWKDALVPSLKEAGGEVVCFDSNHFGGMILSTRKVAEFLRAWKADLVHCHLPLAGVVGRLAARSAKAPVVYTEHNLIEKYNPWTRWMSLRTWKLQNLVIAVSSQVKDSIVHYAGESVPIQIVENGIDVETFHFSEPDRHRIRKQFNIPSSAPVIGTVTVFRAQKDLQTWMKAAQNIVQRNRETHFLLVGDGPTLRETKIFSEELGLGDCVHFAGLQEDVPSYYSAMDVYMNSSVFEGLPLALLESMAMRLPVVATRVGGMPNVVSDQRSGFLVPPSSPIDLAESVLRLLAQGEKRNEFGAAGRKIVEERYSMKRMMGQLEAIYTHVLENSIN